MPSLTGLEFFYHAHPALKRWAEICRPTLWDSDVRVAHPAVVPPFLPTFSKSVDETAVPSLLDWDSFCLPDPGLKGWAKLCRPPEETRVPFITLSQH